MRFRWISAVCILVAGLLALRVGYAGVDAARRFRVDSAMANAVHGGDWRATETALEAGADPNVEIPVTEFTLKGALNANWMFHRNMTFALSIAAANSDNKVVALLLQHGARVDCRDADGWTPLMLACLTGSVDSVRLLIRSGADVNAHDCTCFDPLYCDYVRDKTSAARMRSTAQVRQEQNLIRDLLIQHGAHASSVTPIVWYEISKGKFM